MNDKKYLNPMGKTKLLEQILGWINGYEPCMRFFQKSFIGFGWL